MKWILPFLAVISNFLMDEIQFHWSRFFGEVIHAGSKLEQWFNPDLSWLNKADRYFQNDLLTFLFSTVFVFATDFWHFLKFVMLTSIILFILLMIEKGRKWWQYIIMVLFLEFCWGFVWECLNALFNII